MYLISFIFRLNKGLKISPSLIYKSYYCCIIINSQFPIEHKIIKMLIFTPLLLCIYVVDKYTIK